MNFESFLKTFSDPYDKKARVFPGLLVVLPILVPILWIFGPKNPYLTALLALCTSCGVLYWLANIARNRGKAIEEKLVAKWGGMPTTQLLRHRDPFLDSTSTTRYHTQIQDKLGIALPDAAAELADAAKADDLYRGATKLLIEKTRGKGHALLLKENIAYGFQRNMLGMKPFGVMTCICGIGAGMVLAKVIQFKPWQISLENLLELGAAGGMTFIISLVLLVAWLTLTEETVRRVGIVYAERLFESLAGLPTQRKRQQ
jgi:hypothetical protein